MKRFFAAFSAAIVLTLGGVTAAAAQDTGVTEVTEEATDDQGDTGLVGLAGLLGLLGLLGLKRNDRGRTVVRDRDDDLRR